MTYLKTMPNMWAPSRTISDAFSQFVEFSKTSFWSLCCKCRIWFSWKIWFSVSVYKIVYIIPYKFNMWYWIISDLGHLQTQSKNVHVWRSQHLTLQYLPEFGKWSEIKGCTTLPILKDPRGNILSLRVGKIIYNHQVWKSIPSL